jgi:hypothetical protein
VLVAVELAVHLMELSTQVLVEQQKQAQELLVLVGLVL